MELVDVDGCGKHEFLTVLTGADAVFEAEEHPSATFGRDFLLDRLQMEFVLLRVGHELGARAEM